MLHPEFIVDDVYAAIDIRLTIYLKKKRHWRDDLRQQIIIAVMERSLEYDPARASWETYLDRTIVAQINRFILDQRWLKNQSPQSLEEISEDDLPRLNDVHSWELNMQEAAVFAYEVREVIAKMPERLRLVAENLMFYSQAETAEMMNVAPNVLQHDVEKLKKIFEKANMDPNNFDEN